jgi:serine O-acetyltransferase
MFFDRELLNRLYGDYVRHGRTFRNPGLWVLFVYRYGVWSRKLPNPARWITSKIYGSWTITLQILTGTEIYCETVIGDDLNLIHATNIKIHPDVVIGDRCGMMHEVTLGTNAGRERRRSGVPRIGDDVFIGAGAKVLGPITVGDGATIAPNSLVTIDVPPGTTAIGVPARILRFPTQRPTQPTASAPGSGPPTNGDLRASKEGPDNPCEPIPPMS